MYRVESLFSEEVTTVAKSLVGLVDDMKVELSVPPVESMAMAAIIMALKMFCGLDSHTEVMLSHGSDLIKTELPNYFLTTPFSWQEWQRCVVIETFKLVLQAELLM